MEDGASGAEEDLTMQNKERALQVIADEIVRAGHSYERKTCINTDAYVFAVSGESAQWFLLFISGLEIIRNGEPQLRELVRARIVDGAAWWRLASGSTDAGGSGV